jgi:protein-S-isoprenylcysteine O-methyltransferase Ste14
LTGLARARTGLGKVLIWGDVAFWLAVLVAAILLGPRTNAWVAGIILAAISFPLWIVARMQLGSAFSITPQARGLVTSGLYAKMRHPVYVFGTVASLGALLALQIRPLFLIGVVLVPISLLRARREQQVLAAAFGDEYRRYVEKTWF